MASTAALRGLGSFRKSSVLVYKMTYSQQLGMQMISAPFLKKLAAFKHTCPLMSMAVTLVSLAVSVQLLPSQKVPDSDNKSVVDSRGGSALCEPLLCFSCGFSPPRSPPTPPHLSPAGTSAWPPSGSHEAILSV